ncbi:MAG: alpha/beta fold hydrolase [Heliomarina sp.]|uniref:alpha/beta fold hydrolase n=1 Tax=Heliomarina sp. TaxID=2917556 RepID=UPI00405A2CC7
MTFVIALLLLLIALLLGLYLWTQNIAKAASAMVPQAGEIRPVNGGAIHFVEMGEPGAPPLVLIHGISGQLQHFTYAMAGMLARDFHVYVVDRPGCGYSHRDRDEDAALPVQARMIGEFLDAKGIEDPMIVGHSLGGAVTLAMALDRPEKTRAIALIAPLTHVQDAVDPVFKGLELRSPRARRLVASTVATPLARAGAEKVLAHVFSPEPPVDNFLTRGGAALGLRPGAFVAASGDLVALEKALPEQVARYGELTVPGGVLYGAADALLDPETQGRSMERYGLTCEFLPDRGHMLPLTAPEDCADFIRRIWARTA